jgi:hypothetical protein
LLISGSGPAGVLISGSAQADAVATTAARAADRMSKFVFMMSPLAFLGLFDQTKD